MADSNTNVMTGFECGVEFGLEDGRRAGIEAMREAALEQAEGRALTCEQLAMEYHAAKDTHQYALAFARADAYRTIAAAIRAMEVK